MYVYSTTITIYRGSIMVRDTTIHFEWVEKSIMYVNVHQIFVVFFIRDENIHPNL